MDNFFNNTSSDVVFVVDGVRVPALKQCLINKSRVFSAMFSGNFSESSDEEVVIKDTTFEAFLTMIRFLYSDELFLKDENDFQLIGELYYLSDRYEVLPLKNRLFDNLKSRLSFESLTQISRKVFDLNIEEIIDIVMAFIAKNINELVRKGIKQLSELNAATDDRLLDVLTGDNLYGQNYLVNFIIDDQKLFTMMDLFSLKDFDEILINDKNIEVISNDLHWNYGVFNEFIIFDTTFDAFKTFIGYLYFNRLIIKDNEDLDMLEEVRKLANRYGQLDLLDIIKENLQ